MTNSINIINIYFEGELLMNNHRESALESNHLNIGEIK
mgnify:CR=1 FL=1|jgi:hypothetical protein|tara:strand:+ start:285 stop:398 length:114 start_codon:yes stop_codon:yes gene_type:complete